jgi:hypothetical protein
VVPLKVLFVSPEVEPFIKVGGLADMVGSLPKALAAHGNDVRVVFPAYGSLRLDSTWHARPDPLGVDVGPEARWSRTWETVLPGSKVPVYALEHEEFFSRPEVYAGLGGNFPDNDLRFAFLCRGALNLCLQLGWIPDVVHAHDWTTGLLPVLLNVPRRLGRGVAWFWWALAGSFAVFGWIDHGHASHRAPGQIAGLGLLLVWIPLLWAYGAAWAWTPGARRWALAAGAWWTVLVASGWATFLPGVSEAWKFTHVLVAHAHLAMAGLVTAVNFVVLHELDAGRPTGGRGVFWTWQIATVAHVILVFFLGVRENSAAADLFYGADWTRWIFAGRLLAGLAMLGAAAAALAGEFTRGRKIS